MLANHFFLIRDYKHAADFYEKGIVKKYRSITVRKKIVICYVMTGQIEKAFNEFCGLIEEDIEFITNTNLASEDCPCPDIISMIERDEMHFGSQFEKYVSLGMLWLYCDIDQSIVHLKKAFALKKRNTRLIKIIDSLNSKSKEN